MYCRRLNVAHVLCVLAGIQQGEGRPLKHQRKHPEELRAVIAITRHGDRTPKQKMKMKISFPEFLAFYNKYSPGEDQSRTCFYGVSSPQYGGSVIRAIEAR